MRALDASCVLSHPCWGKRFEQLTAIREEVDEAENTNSVVLYEWEAVKLSVGITVLSPRVKESHPR